MSRYLGSEGEAYFAHREPLRHPDVQRRQARAFARYIAESWTVLDFGCGTGDILAGLDCRTKIGIEVNEPSVRRARENGLEVYDSVDAVASDSVDAVIANHSLEHLTDPTAKIRAFHRVLKPEGLLLAVVPAENPGAPKFRSWHEEMNKHLFSWTPLSLGNLVIECGFRVKHSVVQNPARAGRYTDFFRGLKPAHTAALYLRRLLVDDQDILCIAHAVKDAPGDRALSD